MSAILQMNSSKQYNWYKIAENDVELANGNTNTLLEIEVKGKRICIAKLNEQLYACAAKCPHAGGTMSHGFVDAFGNIVCPLHRYKFSLQNGRNISGEGYYLKTWPIEKREDGIYIGLDKSSFF